MRLPSRVTPYRSSTFAKFPVILSALREWDMSPRALYNPKIELNMVIHR